MVEKDLIEQIRNSFHAYRPEREDILQQNLTKTFNNLSSRNMLGSSIAGNDISRLYAEELKNRSDIAWNSIKIVFDKRGICLSLNDANEIKDEIKKLINLELKRLSDGIKSKLNNMNLMKFMNEIDHSLGSARNQSISKINAELNFYTSLVLQRHFFSIDTRAAICYTGIHGAHSRSEGIASPQVRPS